MTRREARDLGHEPGFVLAVQWHASYNFPLYLADYRQHYSSITTELDRAEWFARLIDAAETAVRLSFLTGGPYTPLAEPGFPPPGRCERCECRPLLTAEDALRAAAEHFVMEADNDSVISGTLARQVARTAWGTVQLNDGENQPIICRHLIDPTTCPACTQERRDEDEAAQLAARDIETVEHWRRDFCAWVGDTDADIAAINEPTTEVWP